LLLGLGLELGRLGGWDAGKLEAGRLGGWTDGSWATSTTASSN
jgi:hypothetical protein